MQHKKVLMIARLGVAVLVLFESASAQSPTFAYRQIATIAVPGGLAGFDISWVDPGSELFYLTDRTATKGTGRIDVIDGQTNRFLYSIPTIPNEFGFVGNAGPGISGPNGVVAIPQKNQLYVGDGDSNVKVVDLAAKAIVAIIPTGGKFRADELAYDPLDRIVMIANDADTPPFLTFISVDSFAVLGQLSYGADQVGLEQPVWNPQTKRFLISVPASAGRFGEVDEINPLTMQISNR